MKLLTCKNTKLNFKKSILFIIIAISIVMSSKDVKALDVYVEDGIEYHEGFGYTLHNLLEDILWLMPKNFIDNYGSNVNMFYDKLSKPISAKNIASTKITEKVFKDRLSKLSSDIRNKSSIETQISSLSDIMLQATEIAMASPNYDPFDDVTTRNMKQFIANAKNQTHKIAFTPPSSYEPDLLIKELFDLRKIKKDSVYPYLVNSISKIWYSAWIAAGKSGVQVSKKFVRKTPLLDVNEEQVAAQEAEKAAADKAWEAGREKRIQQQQKFQERMELHDMKSKIDSIDRKLNFGF